MNKVLRVCCEPGWRMTDTWSRRLVDQDLWFVFAGRGQMRLGGGRRVDLFPGMGIWARPGGNYLAWQHARDRLGVLAVHFEGVTPPDQEVFEFTDAGYAERVLNRVVELAGHAQRPLATRLLDALLADITSGQCIRAAGLTGTARRHHTAVEAVAARIRERPSEIPSVSDLARKTGYSTDHFTRVFRQIQGVTPRDFIIDARITRARQLLTETAFTISQIAEVLGYESVYFFSRQFRQKTGLTPTQHRAD